MSEEPAEIIEESEAVSEPKDVRTVTHSISYLKWLPYLDLKPAHPLASAEPQSITDAKEIFQFFKESHPKDPFREFLDRLNDLPVLPQGETKVSQVLRYVRMIKLAKSHKREFDKLNSQIKRMKGS